MRWLIIFIILYTIFTIYYANYNPKKMKLPKYIPCSLMLVYFDNGIAGYWYSPREKNDKMIFCLRGLDTFEETEHNTRQLEQLFPNYDIIYVETPGVGISSHVVCTQNDLLLEIYNVYTNVLRYSNWRKIGFVALDYGAVLQSQLYVEAQKRNTRLPNWIIQLNGFSCMDSIILCKIPSLLQFCFWKSLKLNSFENYKECLLPILIFHSKNNKHVPFAESVRLYFQLHKANKNCKMIPLYGHDEMTLLSKENMEIISKSISFL